MSPNPKPNLSLSDTSVTQTDTFNLTQKQIQMARTTKKTATNNSTEIETVIGPLTADTVTRIMWRACDTFRGVVEPSSYKDYICFVCVANSFLGGKCTIGKISMNM